MTRQGRPLRWMWAMPFALGAGLSAYVGCLPDLVENLCGNGFIDLNEQCDQGQSSNLGCNSLCQIDCQNADGGSYGYDRDLTSNHCYFTAKPPVSYDDARQNCIVAGAHLVTFADQSEATNVQSSLQRFWPTNPSFWVGLRSTHPGGVYASDAPNEPGWSPPAVCPGCFVPGPPTARLPLLDAGADAGESTCVVESVARTAVSVVGANASAEMVCEREPLGSRSRSCFGGDYCFNVMASTKTYVYDPNPTTVEAAERFCSSLTDGGASSLVVFSSRREREQVVYELSQLERVKPGTFPNDFWIGLSRRFPPVVDAGDAGGEGGDAGSGDGGDGGDAADDGAVDAGPVWIWDNGVKASISSRQTPPALWGNDQPGTTDHVHAYIDLQPGGYDVGLAYATAEEGKKDAVLPYICQF